MKLRGNNTGVIIGLFLLILAIPQMIVAQGEVFAPEGDWIHSEDPRFYENVIQEKDRFIQQDRWAELFTHLQRDAEQSPVNWNDAEFVQQRMIAALEAAADELMKIDLLHGGNYLRNLDKLDTGRFSEGTAGPGFVAFMGMTPPIVLCMPGAESIPGQENGNPCSRDEHPVLTDEQAEDIRYRMNTANRLMMILRTGADEAITEAIGQSYRRWENFLDNGFVMYPWEISVNSALLTWDIRTPPARQFIILHPSLGIQFPLDGIRDPGELRVKESLMIELFGHLWYRGEYLGNFSGLSATVVLREDIAPGIGVLLRPGRNLSAGINWHFSSNDDKRFIKTPFLSVSVDLLNLVRSNRGKIDF